MSNVPMSKYLQDRLTQNQLTSAYLVPVGTAAQRPSATTDPVLQNGMVRYNSDASLFEFYENGAWVNRTSGGISLSATNNWTADQTFTGANLIFATLGKGVRLKEGANARMGVATLVAGAVTVPNTSVTANTRIFVFHQTVGGTAGFLVVDTRTPGTSFHILSSSNTDTSIVAFILFEPSP